MAEVKWIKIVTDIFDDEKVLLIESLPDADSIIVIWFKLLCLAGKQNNNGIFMLNDKIAYTEEMLATVFRRPINTVRLAIDTFEQFGMIEVVDGVITIPNWEKHQNVEGMEKIREQTRQRVANYREKQKMISCNATVTLRNATDKNKNKKENKNKDKNKNPTIEEVTAYINEKQYNVDPKQFFEYYDASDWHDKDGKPVKNWKQRVISWNGRAEKKAPPKQNGFHNFDERKTDMDADVMNKFNSLF